MTYARFRLWLWRHFHIRPPLTREVVRRDAFASNRIAPEPQYRCPICGDGVNLRGEWPATLMRSWGYGSAVCRKCVERAKILNTGYVFANAKPPLHFRKRGQGFEECVRMIPKGGTIIHSMSDGAYWREEIGESGPIIRALRTGKLTVSYTYD